MGQGDEYSYNMGSQDYVLRRGDAIVTLLLLNLSDAAKVDWLARRKGRPGGPPTQRDVDRLSADFLNVDQRASAIAGEAVNKAELQTKKAHIWVPIYAAIASTVIVGLFGVGSALVKPGWVEPLQQVRESIVELKSTRDVDGLKRKVEELEKLVQTLLTDGGQALARALLFCHIRQSMQTTQHEGVRQ